MKRHKSLVSLSREHHRAVVQAHNVRYLGSEKITLPTQEVVDKFLSFWEVVYEKKKNSGFNFDL